MKKLYEIDHPYYCEESGYYYRTPETGWGAEMQYNSIVDYYKEWKDCDLDLNMIFRWDWRHYTPEEYEQEHYENISECDKSNLNSSGNYSVVTIFYMLQRKGCKKIIKIYGAEEKHEKLLKKHLSKAWENMQQTWEGVS